VPQVTVLGNILSVYTWSFLCSPPQNPVTCLHHEQLCGLALAHNGDFFACYHHDYPEYRLDNNMTDNLAEMVDASLRKGVGMEKEAALPRQCRECEVLAACRGMHEALLFSLCYGEPGRHYLCAGYKNSSGTSATICAPSSPSRKTACLHPTFQVMLQVRHNPLQSPIHLDFVAVLFVSDSTSRSPLSVLIGFTENVPLSLEMNQ
jgi:radical SAM protein with 4Fe4S-binding SPASM domain